MNKSCALVARKFLASVSFILALNSCAMSPPGPWHAFSFDGWADKWAEQVDLLEYQYGDQYAVVHKKVIYGHAGIGSQGNVNGPMPVGDFLLVKWRIKQTGEIINDRVDLRGRLASDMREHRVTFVIDGRQLYVYLVTPIVKRQTEPPLLKTTESRYHLTYEIYPNNSYRQERY